MFKAIRTVGWVSDSVTQQNTTNVGLRCTHSTYRLRPELENTDKGIGNTVAPRDAERRDMRSLAERGNEVNLLIISLAGHHNA